MIIAHYHRDSSKEYSDKESKRLRRAKIIGGVIGAGLEGASRLAIHNIIKGSGVKIHPLHIASGLGIMGATGAGIGAAVGHRNIQREAKRKKMSEWSFDELIYLGEQRIKQKGHYHSASGAPYSSDESKRLRKSKMIGAGIGLGVTGLTALAAHHGIGSLGKKAASIAKPIGTGIKNIIEKGGTIGKMFGQGAGTGAYHALRDSASKVTKIAQTGSKVAYIAAAPGMAIGGGIIGAAVGHRRIQKDKVVGDYNKHHSSEVTPTKKDVKRKLNELIYLGEQAIRFGMDAETKDLIGKMSKAKTGNVLNKKDHKMLKKHSKKWHGK